ncbi:6677_t:CDS:2 [Funneliformis geosporum]|uniref:8517_t:CDS:1 n=1 Tax=Funneliformis geosporum TaxID=1117311 RepID=A0A9W4SB43_9GLOM|nr:6677_t:CDS:2 [Funneliformis geosporum]CAI2162451.1 8517_t:CDS:2 [Funneliformis geosporum]
MNIDNIKVPTNSIGFIKGRGGANIMDIQRRSGATCNINGNNIVVTGSNEARRIAINLIEDCVHNSTVVYNHPIEAVIALRPPLVGLKRVSFVKYQGNVDMNNVNKALFVLDEGEELGVDDELDELSHMENLNLDSIIAPKDDEPLVELITERLIEQITKPSNKDRDFRIKVNIGKQLFYPAIKTNLLLPPSVPLARLLKYKIGYKRDVKVIFMNHISFDIAKIIESRLVKLGYMTNDDEFVQRASIHLIDVNAKKRFTISTDITLEGALKIRKYSSDSTKHLLLSFTRSKCNLDFRFRILSKEPPIKTIPSNLINIINKASYDLGARTIHLKNTTEFTFITIRVKTKRKFFNSKGEFSNGRLKVTISEVQEKGNKDVQVSVTNDAFYEILEKIKDKSDEALEIECKKEVVKFVNEMYRLVDGLQYDFTSEN